MDSEQVLIKLPEKILEILKGYGNVDEINNLIKTLDKTILNKPLFNLNTDGSIKTNLTLLNLVDIFNKDISDEIESDPKNLDIKFKLDLIRDEILCKLDPESCLPENNLNNPKKLERLIGALSLRGGSRRKRNPRILFRGGKCAKKNRSTRRKRTRRNR